MAPGGSGAVAAAYGCGLRVSEIPGIKVSGIDSARMLIRVEQGRGRRFAANLSAVVILGPEHERSEGEETRDSTGAEPSAG